MDFFLQREPHNLWDRNPSLRMDYGLCTMLQEKKIENYASGTAIELLLIVIHLFFLFYRALRLHCVCMLGK